MKERRFSIFDFRFSILFFLFASCASQQPAPTPPQATLVIYWDANPPNDQVTGYRVYSAGKFIAATASTSARVKHGTYSVSAVNVRGEGPRSVSIKI